MSYDERNPPPVGDNVTQIKPKDSKPSAYLGAIQFCRAQLGQTVRYNEFNQRMEVREGERWREWQDIDELVLLEAAHEADRGYGLTTLSRAATRYIRSQKAHPVREYLNGRHWDGTPRLDLWLVDHLGAENTAYTQAAGAAWMIAAVARIMEPGCKVDSMLVLEGEQGIGKSEALRVLANGWFTDSLPPMATKAAQEAIQGVWIIEVAELAAMYKREAEHIKAFLTVQADRYREAYGRHSFDRPRQCVFAGTTNKDEYLSDETGNRRFWPVRCGDIDTEALAEARDQLWAEAVSRYRDGGAWWLPPELVPDAQEVQRARLRADPWTGTVTRIARRDYENNGFTEMRNMWMPLGFFRVINHGMGETENVLDESRITKKEEMRVAEILKAEGWVKVRRRIRGVRTVVYEPGRGVDK